MPVRLAEVAFMMRSKFSPTKSVKPQLDSFLLLNLLIKFSALAIVLFAITITAGD